MNNNDVLHSIQQVLQLSEANLGAIFNLSGHAVDAAMVSGMLKTNTNSAYIPCTNQQLALFLDGLISYRRGEKDKQQAEKPDTPAQDNNLIMKKLRIAFDLKEDDLIDLMSNTHYEISKSEISAIFRKPGNKHYRPCSDALLLAFLTSLTFRQWT